MTGVQTCALPISNRLVLRLARLKKRAHPRNHFRSIEISGLNNMPLWRYFKFANQHAVRESAAVALTASAPAPNSGFVFVDNSQGASAAIAELARSLDFALDLINLERNCSCIQR